MKIHSRAHHITGPGIRVGAPARPAVITVLIRRKATVTGLRLSEPLDTELVTCAPSTGIVAPAGVDQAQVWAGAELAMAVYQ
jgi:hypothetical protein